MLAAGDLRDGLLLVDKASGWTSHDVVARVRRLAGLRRIGHTGTLDPMATGLLVLALGNATRLVEYLTAHDKRYEGLITLGATTDTDDAEGRVTATAPVPELPAAALAKLSRHFTGALWQSPPAFSAVKVGGRRAYAMARAGDAVELAARPVVVHALTLSEAGPGTLRVTVHCGPGTYVRSLARDIGQALGCGAHLSALRRLAVGAFGVAEGHRIEDIERLCAAGSLGDAILPADDGLLDWPAAILGEQHAKELGWGQLPEVETSASESTRVRAYSRDGEFLAIAEVAGAGRLRPVKVLFSSPPTTYV